MNRVLKLTGDFYFHWNSMASHYIKNMLDEVFWGEGVFLEMKLFDAIEDREISSNYFSRKHDAIFFYVKNKDGRFFNEDLVRISYVKLKVVIFQEDII